MKKQLHLLAVTFLLSTTAMASYSGGFGGSSSSRYPFDESDSTERSKGTTPSSDQIVQRLKEQKVKTKSVAKAAQESIDSLTRDIMALNAANKDIIPVDSYGRPLALPGKDKAGDFMANLVSLAQKNTLMGSYQEIQSEAIKSTAKTNADIHFYEDTSALNFLHGLMDDHLTYRQICTTQICPRAGGSSMPFNAATPDDQEYALTNYPMRDNPVNLNERFPLAAFVISGAYRTPRVNFELMDQMDDFSRNALVGKLGRLSEQCWTEADKINTWIDYAYQKAEEIPSRLVMAQNSENKILKKMQKSLKTQQDVSELNLKYQQKQQKRQDVEKEKNFLDHTLGLFDDIMAVVRLKGQVS